MTDNALEEAVFDRVAAKLDADPKNDAAVFRRLPKGEQMIVATFELEGEVNNGGFVQYYWNRTGRFSQAAAEGFHLIKAVRIAKLVDRANQLWAKDKSIIEHYKRKGTNEAFAESYKHTGLTKLDDEFFQVEKTENVTKLRAAYIRSHLTDFVDK